MLTSSRCIEPGPERVCGPCTVWLVLQKRMSDSTVIGTSVFVRVRTMSRVNTSPVTGGSYRRGDRFNGSQYSTQFEEGKSPQMATYCVQEDEEDVRAYTVRHDHDEEVRAIQRSYVAKCMRCRIERRKGGT